MSDSGVLSHSPTSMTVAVASVALTVIGGLFLTNYSNTISAKANSESTNIGNLSASMGAIGTEVREHDQKIADLMSSRAGNENDFRRIETAIGSLQSVAATLSAENQSLKDTANVLKDQVQEQSKQLQALDFQLRPFRSNGH